MDPNKMVAITAHMEGESVIVKNIGKKLKVSEMELMCLCTFAKLGLLETFSHLDGHAGYEAAHEMDLLKDAIRKQFGDEKRPNGLHRLGQSYAAILCQGRLEKYVVEVHE